jgi:hypothetical protein
LIDILDSGFAYNLPGQAPAGMTEFDVSASFSAAC